MWFEWSPAAFARAAAENRPILLSLVTAWSDECAMMDQATYAQHAVASVIEERFVPMRVDADRRPDINERYNLGGWPTTVFLTSEGDILSGGTYFDAPQLTAAMLHVADAYRNRVDEIRARSAAVRSVRIGGRLSHGDGQPDRHRIDPAEVVAHFRSLLINRFDPVYGGFGAEPKHPHQYALLFALSLAGQGERVLEEMVSTTLDQMTNLWDVERGGFYRYADSRDWSSPNSGKTLEENAALLHVYVEAALQLRDERFRERAAAIVRWVKGAMIDSAEGGFFNAASSRGIDRTMYVDKNAIMAGAFIRAAALFDDIWLRDFALKSLDAVIAPAYKPGDGVAHVRESGGGRAVRGLLTDQIHVAGALIWAHAATGQLPYSMLAAELMQFVIRTMWDEGAGAFRDRVDLADPVIPFQLNCHAAVVLDRLGILTSDVTYQDRARLILETLANDYRRHDLLAAAFALTVREVFDRHPPAGLELSPVDWQLGRAGEG